MTSLDTKLKQFKFADDCSERLNVLAREQMKHKLLADIMVDLTVCQIEGWDYKSYLFELRDLVQSIIDENGNTGFPL